MRRSRILRRSTHPSDTGVGLPYKGPGPRYGILALIVKYHIRGGL